MSATADLLLEVPPILAVGDYLRPRMSVRNRGRRPIVLVRPQLWSWVDGSRQAPSYQLRWTDAAGNEIPDPLGFASRGGCTVGEYATTRDLVRVAPGETRHVPDPRAPNPDLRVEATARPGAYHLRLRYLATGFEEADDLQLVSASIPVMVTGGSEAAWRCLEAEAKEEDGAESTCVPPTLFRFVG